MPEIEEQAATNGAGDGGVVEQPKFSKDSWLQSAGDLQEAEVDVPGIGDSVVIRSLSAGQQARIRDDCMLVKGDTVRVDSRLMAILTFERGVVEPKFTQHEVEQIAVKFGKAFDLVVGQINEISQATEEDIAKAKRRFRPRR